MSNLPPPSFDPPSFGAAPTPPNTPPPAGSAAMPPPTAEMPVTQAAASGGGGALPPRNRPAKPPSDGSRTPKIIIAIIVVAAVAGGVIFLATRKSDKSDKSVKGTVVVPTVVVPSTTVPAITLPATLPESTIPETTEAATSTTVEATTTTEESTTTTEPATTTTMFALPAGAVDLGMQTYIPLPAGWTQSQTGDHQTTITDGTTSVSISVVARTPGEDPATLLQTYVASLDALGPSVAYSPATALPQLTGALPVNVTTLSYVVFDPTKGVGTTGTVNAYQRGDGLSAIYDVYGPQTVAVDGVMAFQASLTNAAAIGPVSALAANPAPFRLT
ncbi:MAG TPA: hypothetical protein VGM78_04685, partial [Ilumatobacteraceae bacterium]